MKKLAIFTAITAASLIATKSYSQVYVNAHVGFRVPGARVYVGTAPVAPPVVYQQAPVYEQQAPVYDNGYDGGYYADPQVCESDYPGYVYYDYPAWYGHFRDRVYFDHYRPLFERDHRAYFLGGRFDHARFDHDRGYGRGGVKGGVFERGGFERGGFERGRGLNHDRGFDHGRGNDRGGHRGWH